METIKELKNICAPSDADSALIKVFYRKISYYATWILLSLRFSGNQVSLLGMILGLIGAIFFVMENTR